MRVLIEVGYQFLLLADNVNVGAVIHGLEGAQVIGTEGYGEARRYVVNDKGPLKVELVKNDSVLLPENQDATLVTQLVKLTEEKSALQSKVWELEAKVKKFTAVCETAKESTK